MREIRLVNFSRLARKNRGVTSRVAHKTRTKKKKPKRRKLTAPDADDLDYSTPDEIRKLNQERQDGVISWDDDGPRGCPCPLAYCGKGIRSIAKLNEKFPSTASADEDKERGTWNSQIEGTLACMGYAIGLSNVIKFPFLLHAHGRGAFLLAYLIVVAFCGVPLVLLEMLIGQYLNEGAITIWKVAPIFKGIGYVMVLISSYTCIYAGVVTSWALYYIGRSLVGKLPWDCCGTSLLCVSLNITRCGEAHKDDQSFSVNTMAEATNSSRAIQNLQNLPRIPADVFFHETVLGLMKVDTPYENDNQSGYWDAGALALPQPHLAFCLLLVWLAVGWISRRGIKSIGRAAVVLVPISLTGIVFLMMRIVLESGLISGGISYLLKADFSKLGTQQAWLDAITAVIISYGTCTGVLHTYASHNRYHTDVLEDTVAVVLANLSVDVMCGFLVFGMAGLLSSKYNFDIERLFASEATVSLVVLTQSFSELPIPPAWSLLFFLTLLSLGLSSIVGLVITITTALTDRCEGLRDYKVGVTFTVCFCLFVFGLSFTSTVGFLLVQIIERYAVCYAALLVGLIEVIVFVWLYGLKHLNIAFTCMSERKLSAFWNITWLYACPAFLITGIALASVNFRPLSYRGVTLPESTNEFGILLALATFCTTPIAAIYVIYLQRRRSNWRGFKAEIKALMFVREEMPERGRSHRQHKPFTKRIARLISYWR